MATGSHIRQAELNAHKGWEVWARVPYSLNYSLVQDDNTFYYLLMCELGQVSCPFNLPQSQKVESKTTYLTRRWDGKLSALHSSKVLGIE